MVKAGVYLIIRIAPILEGTIAGYIVTLVGGITFLLASCIAVSQSNGKKLLAYSTIANLGLIEYDVHDGFVLPQNIPLMQYGSTLVQLKSNERIHIGNVRLTTIGRVLFDITKVPNLYDFLEFCSGVWNKKGIGFKIGL
jgi:hypothetical protein